MIMKNYITTLLMALCVLAAGCSTDDAFIESDDDKDGSGENTTTTPSEPSIVDPDNEDDFVENQTFDSTVRITFSGTNAVVENTADGVSVTQSGAGVTVSSTIKGVEYIVSGTASNGFLKIYSDYKFKLQLGGASITNSSGPAINIQSGKRCYVVLSDRTTNSLTDGNSYTSGSEDQKGCFFSEGQLCFSGKGTISIKSNYAHGICSDDYVRIREGNIKITSAVKDGIHTNDSFIMDDGTLSVVSSSDGIECEKGYIYIRGGTITVNSGDDGIVTSFEGTDASVNPAIVISGGNITVNTTAQKGHALKSTGDISVAAGTHVFKTTGAAAKGIKASGNVVISGSSNTTITTSGNAIVENGDTSSATGVKTGQHFGMTGGTLTIKSSGSGGKGISSGGSTIIDDGYLTITTTGASYSSGNLRSRPKGIKADASFTIHDGTCIISATHEGIEAVNTLTFNGGRVEVTAVDDAINAKTTSTGAIVVNGGYIYAYSSGSDGFDSNGTLTITGGVAISSGTSQPEEGFDCDNNKFTISGGIAIGTGGSTSYPNAGTQHTIIYGASGTSGEYVQLKNSAGESLLVYKLPRTISSMTIFLSSGDIAKSSSYTLVKGGTYSGGTEIFKGYYKGGTYSGGTSTSVSTGTSYYTKAGTTTGGGGKP